MVKNKIYYLGREGEERAKSLIGIHSFALEALYDKK
jgi:hypothetical protein